MRIAVSLLAFGAMSVGCSKPGEDSEAKRTPIPEPAPDVVVPTDWFVPVEVAGANVRNLDASALNASEADYSADDRKAWRLDKLLSDSEFPAGSLIEAIGSDGVGIAMRRPSGDDAPVPVIVLTRRGEVVAAAVKASDPFPDFHGQGGRLKRPGDPFPRLISPLAKLRISDSGTQVLPQDGAATMKSLRIQIGDNPPNAISASVLATVPSSTVADESGKQKTLWNVRDLLDAAVGESSKLVSVQGDETLEVTAEQWADMTIRPILQMNRRGQLKFHWQKGTALAEGQAAVHSVRVLKVKR